MPLYSKEAAFWVERQQVLQQLEGCLALEAKHAGTLTLTPSSPARLVALAQSSPTRNSLQAQQVLLDVAATRHALEQQLEELQGCKALLAERRVVLQSRLVDKLESELQSINMDLNAAMTERSANISSLDGAAGDLQSALRSGNPNKCEQLSNRVCCQLAQILSRMGDAADVGGSNARTIAAASSQWQRIADAALDRSFCTCLTSCEGQPSRILRPTLQAASHTACVQSMLSAAANHDAANNTETWLEEPPEMTPLRKLQVLLDSNYPRQQAACSMPRVSSPCSPCCSKGLNTGDCQQVPHSAALALPAASKATTDDRLKASYQAMLLRIKGQHGKELQSLRSQHKQALALQEEVHQAALCSLRDELQNPARDAEMCILQRDNQKLKDKLALLAGEFDSRVQVASYEARCKAEEQHQAELQKLRGEWAPLQRECQQLRSGMEGLQAEHSAHVTDALAMQQAQHDAAAVRQEQAHAEAMAALESHYTSLLHQRDGELSQLLMELRAIKSAMSSATSSRCDTRQAQHLPAGLGRTVQPGCQPRP